MTKYNQIFKDCLNDDCLNQDTFEIIPDQLFKKCKSPELIGILLEEFEMIKGAQPYYSGLKERGDFAAANKETLYLGLAEYILKKYEIRGRYRWPHAQQRRTLEKIIRLLDKADRNKDLDDKISLARAKAHLYRSRLIRPKGFTVPAKKIEGLYKALDSCLKSDGKWFRHYAGVIALELDRCGQSSENLFENDSSNREPAKLWDLLNHAADVKNLQDHSKQHQIEFYQMRVRLEELKPREQALFTGVVFNDLINFKMDKKGELVLEKLKVAIYRKEKEEIDSRTKHLIKRLKYTFFMHPLWDNSVRFVRRLRKHGCFSDWEDLAIEMWETAEKQTIKTASLHLRWYWSRQRNLYDLAFLAALKKGKVQKAARIADSAKSRPALTWQALENLSRSDENEELRETLETEIENNAKALSGGYIKNLRNQKRYKGKDQQEYADPSELNTESIVVQFYLVHLDEEKKPEGGKKSDIDSNKNENGYALIYDKKKGGWSQAVHRFDFNPLFEKYINWQNTYFRLSDKLKSAGDLEKLCYEMGKALGFLLDYPPGEENRPMVLIPHDFLHRVPLHGVLRKHGDEPYLLLEKFRCSYLPACAYAKNSTNHTSTKKPQIYISADKTDSARKWFNEEIKGNKHFDENKFDISDNYNDGKDKSNTSISFFCHGQADYVNPFNSKLKLFPDLTLADLAYKEDFQGSTVFVSACETDLMGPINAPLDEHLSLAQILFNRGARSVLGTIYEFTPYYPDQYASNHFTLNLDDFVSLFVSSADCQFDKVQTIMSKLLEKYKSKNNNKNLYHYLCYKFYQF